MPVERLIIMRHGETADVAPLIISPPDTPTGNLADTRLSDNGFAQARDTGDELLHKDKPIDVIYSSPSWQSLDTVRVTLRQQCLSSVKYPKLLKVRVEPGLRDWEDFDDVELFCEDQCNVRKPIHVDVLREDFGPWMSEVYESIFTPPDDGWMLEKHHNLLMRAEFTLDSIIYQNNQFPDVKTVLIVTHAPVVLAMSRMMSQRKLEQPGDSDMHNATDLWQMLRKHCLDLEMYKIYRHDHAAGFCGITQFEKTEKDKNRGWAMTLNGDQSHLTTNRGRPWHFRPTQWQNRHEPNPVLATVMYFQDGYCGLKNTWEAVASFFKVWLGACRSRRDRWRRNPYRLPAWVYLVLWSLLFWTILLWAWILRRLIWNYLRREKNDLWNIEDPKDRAELERFNARTDILSKWATILQPIVSFVLFIFPPLMAG